MFKKNKPNQYSIAYNLKAIDMKRIADEKLLDDKIKLDREYDRIKSEIYAWSKNGCKSCQFIPKYGQVISRLREDGFLFPMPYINEFTGQIIHIVSWE